MTPEADALTQALHVRLKELADQAQAVQIDQYLIRAALDQVAEGHLPADVLEGLQVNDITLPLKGVLRRHAHTLRSLRSVFRVESNGVRADGSRQGTPARD